MGGSAGGGKQEQAVEGTLRRPANSGGIFYRYSAEADGQPLAAAGQRVGDVGERRLGVGTNRLNGRQTDDYDQGKHDRIFHRGGTIFRRQKMAQLQSQILHENPPTLLKRSDSNFPPERDLSSNKLSGGSDRHARRRSACLQEP